MPKKKSFEEAAAQLDEVLAELSDEDTSLDRALTLYASAAELIAFCNQTLQNAQIQIDEIDAKLEKEMK